MVQLSLEKLHIRGMTYWTGEPARISFIDNDAVGSDGMKYSHMFRLLIELDGHVYPEIEGE